MLGFIRRLFSRKTPQNCDGRLFTTTLPFSAFSDCILRHANEEGVLPFAKEVIKSAKKGTWIDVVHVDPNGYDMGDEYFDCVWGTIEELFGRDSDIYKNLHDSYRSYYDSKNQLVIEWRIKILFDFKTRQ